MRFGNDDIGYPSLWSERVAVNALWDANKLGVILPTSLWAPDILQYSRSQVDLQRLTMASA